MKMHGMTFCIACEYSFDDCVSCKCGSNITWESLIEDQKKLKRAIALTKTIADEYQHQLREETKDLKNLIFLIRDDLRMRSDENNVINISDFIWDKINKVCE